MLKSTHTLSTCRFLLLMVRIEPQACVNNSLHPFPIGSVLYGMGTGFQTNKMVYIAALVREHRGFFRSFSTFSHTESLNIVNTAIFRIRYLATTKNSSIFAAS